MCGHQENMTNVTVRNVLLIKLPYDSLQVYNTTKNKTNRVGCIAPVLSWSGQNDIVCLELSPGNNSI